MIARRATSVSRAVGMARSPARAATIARKRASLSIAHRGPAVPTRRAELAGPPRRLPALRTTKLRRYDDASGGRNSARRAGMALRRRHQLAAASAAECACRRCRRSTRFKLRDEVGLPRPERREQLIGEDIGRPVQQWPVRTQRRAHAEPLEPFEEAHNRTWRRADVAGPAGSSAVFCPSRDRGMDTPLWLGVSVC